MKAGHVKGYKATLWSGQPVPPICKNCQSWSFAGKNRGQCRLNPPVVVNNMGLSYWSETYDTDWCSKFEPRRTD
jgi:hypothetical protein